MDESYTVGQLGTIEVERMLKLGEICLEQELSGLIVIPARVNRFKIISIKCGGLGKWAGKWWQIRNGAERVNKEITEGICVGIGIGRASVPKMAQAGLPNRGIGGILAMAWK